LTDSARRARRPDRQGVRLGSYAGRIGRTTACAPSRQHRRVGCSRPGRAWSIRPRIPRRVPGPAPVSPGLGRALGLAGHRPRAERNSLGCEAWSWWSFQRCWRATGRDRRSWTCSWCCGCLRVWRRGPRHP